MDQLDFAQEGDEVVVTKGNHKGCKGRVLGQWHFANDTYDVQIEGGPVVQIKHDDLSIVERRPGSVVKPLPFRRNWILDQRVALLRVFGLGAITGLATVMALMPLLRRMHPLAAMAVIVGIGIVLTFTLIRR